MSEHRSPRPSSSPPVLPGVEQERLRSRIAANLFGGEAQPLHMGRYTILQRLGEGGLGIVYSAFDPTLDRKIALKVLRNPEDRSAPSLRAEAQALAKLSHPNIVQVFEVGEHQGQIFMAMEFLPGKSLAHLQRDPELALEQQLDPWIQAGKGLHAMHEKGLVHRDFKPDNAMLLPGSRVKVFDFGLSHSVHGNQALPRPAGTPAYMAPEQFTGSRIDPRADQFSFCLSLWNFCAGHAPSQSQLESNRLAQPASMPAWLFKILERGLRLAPEERHPDTGVIIEALQAQQLKRAKKRGWLVFSLLSAAILLTFAAFLASQNRPDPCTPVHERWDALHAALQNTPTGQQRTALALGTQVNQRLLAYIQNAKQEHGDRCLHAARNPQKAQGEFAAQSSCYFAAAHAIETIRAQLALAKGDSVTLMRWLRAPLPSLQACANRSDALLDENASEERDRLESQLVQAQIKLTLRNYPEAANLATQVLQACPPKTLLDLQAKALLIRARARNVSSELSQAQDDLDQAYRIAETRNDDNLRLEAMVLRVKNSDLQGKHARAEAQMHDAYPLAKRPEIALEHRLEYFAKACRINRRSASVCEAVARCQEGLALLAQGESAPIALNKMQRRLAWTYYEAGQLRRAQSLAHQANLELRGALGTDQDSILTMHGDALEFLLAMQAQRVGPRQDQDWPALTRRAQALYARHVEAYGEQSPYVTTMRNHFAEMLRRSGKLGQARPHFEALLVQMAKRGERYYPLTKLGQIFIAQGQIREGIQKLKQAIAVIEDINSGQKANAIPELGTAHFALAQSLNNKSQRIQHAQKALQVFELLESRAKDHALHCAPDSSSIPLYAREREGIEAWLRAQKARPAPPQKPMARR